MDADRSWSKAVLNVALVVFGFGMVVLLYSFAAGSILPEVFSPTEELEEEEVADRPDRIVQVAVRNGAGVSGIARQTTSYLRGKGFDVVEAGNHTSFDVEQSQVVDRAGDMEVAQYVAQSLGIPEGQVHQDVRPDAYLDAAIIIGQDYEILEPFKNP